jgi:nitroimidazol reductase NimA-like FMN-containing flavoprotein (pyridoxamine 5'-phosphate oxidase superfamily)
MLIHELSERDCFEILGRGTLGRLGCARHDQPYLVPIHFSFDPDRRCLYAFSAVGQKIEWMRDNPKVCLEVEEITDSHQWTTVVVLGRYLEIRRTPEDAEVRRRAELQFGQRQEWWLPASGRTRAGERGEVVVYSIVIDRITGRRTVRNPR